MDQNRLYWSKYAKYLGIIMLLKQTQTPSSARIKLGIVQSIHVFGVPCRSSSNRSVMISRHDCVSEVQSLRSCLCQLQQMKYSGGFYWRGENEPDRQCYALTPAAAPVHLRKPKLLLARSLPQPPAATPASPRADPSVKPASRPVT
jgi:hypothetical protein